MPYFMLRGWATDEFQTPALLIEVTQDVAREALQRIERIEQLKQDGSLLITMEYLDNPGRWIDINLLPGTREFDDLLSELDDMEIVEIDSDTMEKIGQVYTLHTEVSWQTVESHSVSQVSWEGIIKHTNVRITSARFRKEQLEKILSE